MGYKNCLGWYSLTTALLTIIVETYFEKLLNAVFKGYVN